MILNGDFVTHKNHVAKLPIIRMCSFLFVRDIFRIKTILA